MMRGRMRCRFGVGCTEGVGKSYEASLILSSIACFRTLLPSAARQHWQPSNGVLCTALTQSHTSRQTPFVDPPQRPQLAK